MSADIEYNYSKELKLKKLSDHLDRNFYSSTIRVVQSKLIGINFAHLPPELVSLHDPFVWFANVILNDALFACFQI